MEVSNPPRVCMAPLHSFMAGLYAGATHISTWRLDLVMHNATCPQGELVHPWTASPQS
jgi:hypothetical protein